MSQPPISQPSTGQPSETEDLLSVLRLIAERAGKVILGYYVETEEIEVRHKEDASPVTEADQAAEDFILEALAKLTPEIPVISEEAASAGTLPEVAGSRFWLVDPLDGTKEFLSRNGEFTVNIALIEDGLPVAGVVHAPALAMTWAGAKDAAAPNGETGRATFSETDKPDMAIAAREIPEAGAVVIASRRHGSGEELDAFLAKYTVADRISAGSSLKFCLVATGKADLYPRFGRTMEWDTAAGHAVLRAAGGRVETTDGRPLAYGKPGFENPHFIAYGKS
ncbi:MAG: 3'(2'),5'-bisphosphate nucleotidase CysQ [Rhodospirillales bacterium]|nr:3'(2'),5'-bisphosphate nucleotidase CysQ [Rhodospirillales bacterium]